VHTESSIHAGNLTPTRRLRQSVLDLRRRWGRPRRARAVQGDSDTRRPVF
jgi:hypothetical protein